MSDPLQYRLGRTIAFTSVVVSALFAIVVWSLMALGMIRFSGMLLFAPIVPLGGLLPGLHAMSLNRPDELEGRMR